MLNDPNLAQDIGFALERVLAPEQNSQSSDVSDMTMDTIASSRASSVSGTYGSNPALMASFLRNILSVFFTASVAEVIENPNVENPVIPLAEDLVRDISYGASQETQGDITVIENVIIQNSQNVGEITQEIIHNINVVSDESSQDSQDSRFSADEAVGVLSNMNRLGGRKRKTRAKKQKGGKRRKTIKKLKKSKLRKYKTLKRRKSYRRRNTRKM
jgi:hypothetical protein